MEKTRSRRRFPTFLRWLFWVLAVQFVLINISAAFYAQRLTHFYTNRTAREPMSGNNVLVKTWRLFTGPRYGRPVVHQSPVFPYDTVLLKTKKGVLIDAWYAATDSTPKGTILLFHGITTTKSSILLEANEFRFQGYNILLVDFRAHGNSGGNTTTIGVRETEEVKLAYDFIRSKGESRILLYGNSMGAVTVMRAVADHGLRPAGLILDMPFASMQTHLQARARLEGFAGFTEKPFGFLVTAWISIERGFNGYRHRSEKYGAEINCPVLLQWGAQDKVVLEKETRKIYKAIASQQKELVIYENAGHESFLHSDPVKWREVVGGFLGKY